VDWLVEASVSEKRAASIFRAEAISSLITHLIICNEITSALKMEAARFSETLASTKKSIRLFNPKEHNQNSSCLVCFDQIVVHYTDLQVANNLTHSVLTESIIDHQGLCGLYIIV
jgi:hypothetical protein